MSQHSSASETGLAHSLQAHWSQAVSCTAVTRVFVNLLVGLHVTIGAMTWVSMEREDFVREYASLITGSGGGYVLVHVLW